MKTKPFCGTSSQRSSDVLVKGSLDENLPSYRVLKMRENSREENRGVENSRESVGWGQWLRQIVSVNERFHKCIDFLVT